MKTLQQVQQVSKEKSIEISPWGLTALDILKAKLVSYFIIKTLPVSFLLYYPEISKKIVTIRSDLMNKRTETVRVSYSFDFRRYEELVTTYLIKVDSCKVQRLIRIHKPVRQLFQTFSSPKFFNKTETF